MTEPLPGVEATDDAVSALAERRCVEFTDPILQALGAWAADLDARPLAPEVPATAPVPALRLIPSSRKRRTARWALGLTAALTLSSTGIAAAHDSSPWSQLRYVTKEVYQLGHREPGKLPDWMVRVGPDVSDRGTAPEVSRSNQRPALGNAAHGDTPGRPGARLGVR